MPIAKKKDKDIPQDFLNQMKANLKKDPDPVVEEVIEKPVVSKQIKEEYAEEPVQIARFFLENADYTISFTPDGNHFHSTIESNGPIQMEKDSLENLIKAAYGETDMDALEKEYMAGDAKVKDSIWAIVQPLLQKGEEVENEYYANNPLSVLTMEEAYSAITNGSGGNSTGHPSCSRTAGRSAVSGRTRYRTAAGTLHLPSP